MLDHLNTPLRGSEQPASARVGVRRRRVTTKASLVEYGLLLAAIVSVLVLVCFALGSYVTSALSTSCDPAADTSRSAAISSCSNH